MSAEPCHLLRLPTELRLHIYDYALCDAEAITISSGEVIDCGFGVYPDSRAEQNIGRKHASIPGLPANHVPIIRRHYDPSLLSITSPAVVIPGSVNHSSPAESFTDSAYASAASLASSSHTSTKASSGNADASWDAIPLSTPLSLLATCRTINAELQSYLQFQKTTTAQYGPALYVSYPTGLLVLKALCPHFLSHARAVYIAGAYHVSAPTQPPENESAISRRLARLDSIRHRNYSERVASAEDSTPSRHPHHYPIPTPEATTALASTVRTLLGPHPHPTLRKLQLRIYYPSEHSYRHVWGDDASPIVVALQNTWGGNIETEVWRGRWGTGVKFEARSNVESRVMSSVWRRLTEKKQSEMFVVGKEWPEESEGSKVGERGEECRVSYGISQT